jgi:hypothetical protein
MSEDQNDVKEEEVVETSETSSVEENPTEEVEESEEEVESTEETETEEPETETGDSTNKGANQRIRELNAKAKAAEEKAQSLAQRIEELTGSSEPQGYQPYTPSIEPGSEVSPEQYRQDVARQADSIVTLRLKQQEAIARMRSESAEAVRKYPELDPDSEAFNKDLSDTIFDATEAYVSKNPYSASVSSFVDRLMKPYQRAISTETGKASENLAKQVSQAALKPTSVRNEEKGVEDKTIAELEAEYGIVNS